MQDLHFSIDTIAKLTLSDFQVVTDLHAEPDSCAGAEIASQAHGGIHRDCALAVDDLADANGSDANIMRQAILSQTERLHEVLEQDFTGMDWGECVVHSHLPLRMIINDFDISCLIVNPLEADAPLVIDANAILTGSFALELLETIAGRG